MHTVRSVDTGCWVGGGGGGVTYWRMRSQCDQTHKACRQVHMSEETPGGIPGDGECKQIEAELRRRSHSDQQEAVDRRVGEGRGGDPGAAWV